MYSDSYLAAIDQTAQVLAAEKIFYQLDFHQDMYNERFQGEGWPDWAVATTGSPPSRSWASRPTTSRCLR